MHHGESTPLIQGHDILGRSRIYEELSALPKPPKDLAIIAHTIFGRYFLTEKTEHGYMTYTVPLNSKLVNLN